MQVPSWSGRHDVVPGTGLPIPPFHSIYDDGHGGHYDLQWNFDGSVEAAHYDSQGNAVNEILVMTDPGYAATVRLDGQEVRWNYDVDGIPTSFSKDDGHGTTTTYYLNRDGVVTGYGVAAPTGQDAVTTLLFDNLGNRAGSILSTTAALDGLKTTQIVRLDSDGQTSGTTSVISDGVGNSVTSDWDAASRLLSTVTTVVTADGHLVSTAYDSYGLATFAFVTSTTPAGVIDTAFYDGNGILTGSVVAAADGNGGVVTRNYDADGSLVSYVVTSSNEQHDTSVSVFEPDGFKMRANTLTASGVQESDVSTRDGSKVSTVHQVDGDYTVTSDDGQGSTRTASYGSSGLRLADEWLRPNGTRGQTAFALDGTSTGQILHPDGSSSSYVNNGSGTTTFTHYAVGEQSPVGTTVTTTGDGGVLTVNFDATGVEISESWVREDGTWGNQPFGSANQAPTPGAPISNFMVSEASPFQLTIPADTFTDPDQDDSLTWSIQLDDGGALPAWLSFDSATRALSGTPTHAAAGTWSLRVTVADEAGAISSQSFDVIVAQPPAVVQTVGEQRATEDQAWTFTISSSTFADADTTDPLAYAATMADDGALPAWLTFDAASRTFQGTPANADVGVVALKVTATDSQGLTTSDAFSLIVANINDAPTIAQPILSQSATEDTPWAFGVPAATFDDVDAGDMLSFRAALEDGSVLPSWLTFEAGSGVLSGTPLNADVGRLTLMITGSDAQGAGVDATFELVVANVNDAPIVSAINSQSVDEDQGWSFTVPPGTFEDVDAGDSLTLTAASGDGSALPAWLAFDPATHTFDGTPLNEDVGTRSLTVTATDTTGASGSVSFALQIANTNDAPVAGAPLVNQTALEDSPWQFTVPWGAFIDVDVGDELVLGAALADGEPLPAWLRFDAATRTLSGTASNEDVGTVRVRLRATDAAGAFADSELEVTVLNTNDAPVVAQVVAAQSAVEDLAFALTVADAFADVDAGDALHLSVTLADGAPLPDWLQFDAATGTLAGFPRNEHVGGLRLQLLATDSAGATAGQQFDVVVANVNDAPVLAQPLAALQAVEDQLWTFTVPPATFEDVDVGDQVILDAKLSDGSELPSWLQFDPAAGTFSGTALNEHVGELALRLSATDMAGAVASTTVALNILNTNDAPVAVGTVPNWSVRAGSTASYALARTSFYDQDIGDALWFRASLADGSPLPAWLRFDAGTLTFSGAPTASDAGVSTLRVSATDSGGASAALAFTLTVGAMVIGGSGKDSLRGTVGDDLLDGGAGADVMAGGMGDDLYLVGSAGDNVVESVGGGYDVVNASTTYTLSANVEQLVLVGGSDINATGNGGDNVLEGNSGANQLRGEAGNDTLAGGRGSDRLDGGTGNDVYVFARGDGVDTVIEDDGTPGNVDTARFGLDIAADQLWFRRDGNHLQVSVLGTKDALVFQHWFKGPAHHVEVFRTSDDHMLLDSQVQNLVNAMAAFSPPAAGQTTLPDTYRQGLGDVISSSWSQGG